MATGTSIEVQNIIWKVYGIFQGVSGTDADIAQSLARVRQPVQRIVWCSKTGRNFCKISRSVNPVELKGHLFERTSVSASLIRSSLKADTLSSLENIDWQSDPSIQLFSQISAAQNFAMYNLRDALYVRLKHEGNPVTLERSPSNSLLKLELQQCKEAIKLTDAMTILNAEDLSLIEIFALEQKEVIAPDEQQAIAKHYIKEFYCLDELTLQDILLDREGRTRGELLNLEAQLFEGVGLDRTVRALERQSSWRQALCPWDIPGTEMRREIRDRIGLTQFIRQAATGWEWAKADLEEIAAVARRFAPAIKAHLNFTITEDMSDVQVIHQLLSQMGIKIEFRWSIHHPSSIGTKIRVYSLNMRHWDLCWSILERREQRRELISSGEDGEIAGSPAELSSIDLVGDPTFIKSEPHAITQNLVRNEKSSYQQPDLPFVWASNRDAV